MSDFTRAIGTRAPTHEEVERILAEARRMRAEVIRNAIASTWAMLRRAAPRKQAPAAPRHA